MIMGSNRYLVRADAEEWSVEHNGRVLRSHLSRDAAIDQARVHARDEKGEVIILDAEGMVVAEEVYGHSGAKDPVG